jgi:hypothetical protein
MILIFAVAVGLAGALLRYRKDALNRIAALPLRSAWILLLAIILQIPLLRAPAVMPHDLRLQQALLLLSYLLLIAFVSLNWRNRGILVVGVGLGLNLLAILSNGGFMPVTAQTLVRINPGSQVQDWTTGVHYPGSKDVIRLPQEIYFWVFSDLLVLPPPFPLPTAFSLGDLVIAAGIIWTLVSLPAAKQVGQS